ncbi:uncharacterized protein HaLaN_23842, partial [Haematococcus lacustris]
MRLASGHALATLPPALLCDTSVECGQGGCSSVEHQTCRLMLCTALTWPMSQVYGFGDSENFLGEFMRESGTSSTVQIATKFAPLPWRLTAGSVPTAAKASLER